MILFFLLLHVIVLLAAPDSTIDWERCSFDAKCYVEGKCQGVAENQPKHYSLAHVHSIADVTDMDCKIGVQIIPFSRSKVLIYMQVIGEKLLDPTIGLYQNESIIVGCENKTGKVEVINHKKLDKRSTPELFDDFSQFRPEYAFCAVVIDRFDKVKWEDIIKNNGGAAMTRLKFFPSGNQPRLNNPSVLPYGQLKYWSSASIDQGVDGGWKLCDPEPFKIAQPRENFHVRHIKNPTQMEMNCDNYNDGVAYKYKLFIQQGNKEPKQEDELVCNSGLTFEGKTGNNITDIDQYDFNAYCAVEMSKTCASPLKCKSGDPNCPTYIPGNLTANAALTCAGGKWVINDKYYENADPECNDDDIIPNLASFYFNLTSDGIFQVSKFKDGECYSEYDCRKRSPVDNSTNVVINETDMYCSEGTQMRVVYENTMLNSTKYYKCNTTTGNWTDGIIEIPPNARVMCDEKAREEKVEQVSMAVKAGSIIACIVGVFILFGIAIFFGIRCVKRSYEPQPAKDLRKWMKFTRDQKVKAAANTFHAASVAEPGSETTILLGLQLIACMLNAETEDPEIWELVYPFLNRLHGSSRRMGTKLTGLLTRYLFVEAKKIIEKHGWRSPKHVSKGKHEGYMRTIAIRLIFYCRFNNYSEEVTKFIAEGFAQLRYDAVEQYPHCGMLWSHVATTRGNKALQQKFLQEMQRISQGKDPNDENKELKEIDEGRKIEAIGSIRDQAAEALGGSLFWDDIRGHETSVSSLGPAHIRGILRTSQLDMGSMMIKLFAVNKADSPITQNYEKLESIITKEKMSEFLDEVMVLLAGYGQMQDAKRLELVALNYPITQDILGLKLEKNTKRYDKIKREQNLFNMALSKESGELTDWLEARQTMPDIKHPNTKRAIRADHSAKSVEDTKRASKSGKTTRSNAETASKVEDMFFIDLLEAPKPKERIRTCIATEDEQTRYRAILEQIFHQDTIIAARVNFAPDDIVEVMTKVKEIVTTEPMLIEDIPAGVTVVSDLNGQLYDLHRVFLAHSVDGKPGYECAKFCFLGNYVDRGYMALELIMALFILKILYPDRIFLLRGNHEFININKTNGFMPQVYAIYKQQEVADHLYVVINECFAHFSIAGIIGNKFFCAHAGISFGSFTRHEFRRLEKPFKMSSEDPLIHDVVWTDPSVKLKGFCFNMERYTSSQYGEDEFIHAMENIGCEGMIRGHQCMKAGQVVVWERLICIFTQTAESQGDNNGAVAMVDEDLKVTFRILEIDTSRYFVAQDFKEQRTNQQKADKTPGRMKDEDEDENDPAEKKEKQEKTVG